MFFYTRRSEVSYLQAAMQCSICYLNANETPNHCGSFLVQKIQHDPKKNAAPQTLCLHCVSWFSFSLQFYVSLTSTSSKRYHFTLAVIGAIYYNVTIAKVIFSTVKIQRIIHGCGIEWTFFCSTRSHTLTRQIRLNTRREIPYLQEGREGVKWELGFAFFRGWEMGFCALGLGFMKRKQQKNGNGISI